MLLGTRENPPPETTLASVYMWLRFPYRPSQSWHSTIINNPYWIFKCADVLLLLSFPWSFRLGEPKCLYEKSCPARHGYPTTRGETTCSPELSRPPRQLGVIHINGCLNFTTTQGKVNLPRVTPGEGCLRYARPYKWGLSLHTCMSQVAHQASTYLYTQVKRGSVRVKCNNTMYNVKCCNTMFPARAQTQTAQNRKEIQQVVYTDCSSIIKLIHVTNFYWTWNIVSLLTCTWGSVKEWQQSVAQWNHKSEFTIFPSQYKIDT